MSLTPPSRCDVFIAGSGPIGATYARILVEKGFSVVMVDVGDQDSAHPGSHKRNNIDFQKDFGRFSYVIQAALCPASVPVHKPVNRLSPSVWSVDIPSICKGANPEQNPLRNVQSQGITRTVGGMATHWTCSTPRFHELERPLLNEDKELNNKEWDRLYEIAEALVGTKSDQFDKSIRHNLILRALNGAGDRKFQSLPLACTRKTDSFVEWSSASTIFDLNNAPNEKNPGRFRLFPNTQCTRLVRDESNNTVVRAELWNVKEERKYTIEASVVILACGPICTPQILANSGFHYLGREEKESLVPNLGRYITEQIMTFCQVVLYRSLVEEIRADIRTSGNPGELDYEVWYNKNTDNKNPDWWNEKIVRHMQEHPEDPLPIPLNDPEPQVTTLFATKEGYNWHTQIHRDAFSYGAITESGVDSRLVVDLRFFGRTEGVKTNQLYFSSKYTDLYGMPQPTFDYTTPPGRTIDEANEMLKDMIDVALKLGGFLPGSAPQFMTCHFAGSHRSGLTPIDSVVDVFSKVWNFPNLFLGGVGNIPSAFGSNPTLTAIGYAIKSCEYIVTHFSPSST